MKKIYRFQNYLGQVGKKYTTNVGIEFLLCFVSLFLGTIFSGMKENGIALIFCFSNLYGFRTLMLHRKPELRLLPVSDKFAVCNLIYISPSILGALSAVALVAVKIVYSILLLVTGNSSPALLRSSLPGKHQLMFGFTFGILFFMGCFCFMWLCCTCFFLTNRKQYVYVGYGLYLVLFFGMTLGLKTILAACGAKGTIYIYQLKDYIPHAWSILLFLWGIVLLLAWIDWKIGLRIYRNGSNLDWIPSTVFKEMNRTSRRNLILFILILFACMILFNLLTPARSLALGYDHHVDYHSDSIEQYMDYKSFDMKFKKGKQPIIESSLVVFPKEVQKEQVIKYVAGAKGGYEGNENAYSMDIASYRYLSVQLGELDYQKEKQRISNISITQDGQTHHLYHDKTHFRQEAYLAVYSIKLREFEYALFDDHARSIQYIYANGISPDQTPAGSQCIPTHDATQVILDSANKVSGNSDSFSIYDFG